MKKSDNFNFVAKKIKNVLTGNRTVTIIIGNLSVAYDQKEYSFF